VKYSLLLPGFNGTRIFSTQFRKKYSNITLMKIRLVVACGRTDGRTDMKLTVAFRGFSIAPKNWWNDTCSRKRKYSEKILPQCHLVYHTSHLVVSKVALVCLYLRAPWSYRLVTSSAFGTAVLKDRLIHRSSRQIITVYWKYTAICLLCNFTTTSLNNGQSRVF
jgi:hypothetical protein